MDTNNWKSQVEKVFAFHTKRAPGIPIGVCMVDWALELLGGKKETTWAISETEWCLPDAIQVAAGLTVGTRKLKIDGKYGRYALTLYDHQTGEGIRIYVDIRKIDPAKTPELHKFFHRTRGPEIEKAGEARTASNQKVIKEFDSVGRDILAWEKVKVKKTGKDPIPPAFICSNCGESALGESKTTCDACDGNSYYHKKDRAS